MQTARTELRAYLGGVASKVYKVRLGPQAPPVLLVRLAGLVPPARPVLMERQAPLVRRVHLARPELRERQGQPERLALQGQMARVRM